MVMRYMRSKAILHDGRRGSFYLNLSVVNLSIMFSKSGEGIRRQWCTILRDKLAPEQLEQKAPFYRAVGRLARPNPCCVHYVEFPILPL